MKSIAILAYGSTLSKTLLLGIILCAPQLAGAQKLKEPRFIYWHERSKLTWDDFKGTEFKGGPQGTPSVVARSRVGVLYENHSYKSSPDTFTVAIKAAFNRLLSPVRPGAKNERLLRHEQLHFDMTEVLTRKMRRAYTLANFNDPAERRQYPRTIKKLKEEYIIQQQAYDEEWYLSAEKQQEWFDKVANELLSLEEYRDPEVKLANRR